MENMNYPDEKRMLELLPDYVFGRLSKDDNDLFESSLSFYPEIEKEAADAKAVFSRFDKMELDKKIDYRVRNLSVKVNQRRKKNVPAVPRASSFIRLAFPAAAVIAITIFIINNPAAKKNLNSIKPAAQEFVINEKVNILIDSIKKLNNDDLKDIQISEPIIDFNKDFSANNQIYIKKIDDEISNHLLDNRNEVINYLDRNTISSHEYYKKLENIDEADFQIIYEELKNVKIES